MFIGDFNLSTGKHCLDVVMQAYNLNNLVNKAT